MCVCIEWTRSPNNFFNAWLPLAIFLFDLILTCRNAISNEYILVSSFLSFAASTNGTLIFRCHQFVLTYASHIGQVRIQAKTVAALRKWNMISNNPVWNAGVRIFPRIRFQIPEKNNEMRIPFDQIFVSVCHHYNRNSYHSPSHSPELNSIGY